MSSQVLSFATMAIMLAVQTARMLPNLLASPIVVTCLRDHEARHCIEQVTPMDMALIRPW